jgi:hypothetical protein
LFGPWLSIALAGADASKVAKTIIAAAENVICRMVESPSSLFTYRRAYLYHKHDIVF